MNKRDLLALCLPNDNEKKLVSLLVKYNNNYGYRSSAEILAFKNSLLLGKTDLNNNALNGLLLKSYVLYLFSNKEIEDNKFNNSLLNNDINTTIELLNNDMSARYFLSYVYVKTISKGVTARGLNIQEKDYDKVGSLLEKINYVTNSNEEVLSRRKTNNKFTRRVSNR